MANALAGFFTGLEAGSQYLSRAEDNATRRAKERLALQGLQDVYADGQVLRDDELRNAKMQYDFDTANRSANLDTLNRTHDGYVDATVAKNLFNTAFYDNEKAGEDQYGFARNDARLANYLYSDANDTNAKAGIDMFGDPENRLRLAKANLGIGDYGIQQKVQDATSNTQYLTGVVEEGQQYLSAQDKYYDAETGLMINPNQRTTTINLADADVSNSVVKSESAKGTIVPRINTNVNNASIAEVNSETGVTVANITQPYKIRTALSNAQFETLTAEDQTAVAKVQSMVSGMPEELQDSALQQIATTSKDNNQRLAAQRLLNSRNQQRQAQQQAINQKINLQANPAQALADIGVDIEPVGDGTYIIEGKVYDEAGVAFLANKAIGDGSAENPYDKILKQGEVTRQNNANKSYQSLYNKLAEDGEISEEDQKLLDQAKAEFMLATGMPVTPAPSAPTGAELVNTPESDILRTGLQNGWWVADNNGNAMVPDGKGGYRQLTMAEAKKRFNDYVGKPTPKPEPKKENGKIIDSLNNVMKVIQSPFSDDGE